MREQRWCATATLVLAIAIGGPISPALAQSPAELSAARALFVEALADENHGYFETALRKFEKVRETKDTANVRYRIATCYEGLGKRAKALAAYRSVLEIAEGDKSAKDAVTASREKVDQLEKIVAHLAIVVPEKAPSDLEVLVDDEKVALHTSGPEIAVDAGPHTIAATGSGMPAFRTQVALPEGGRVAVTIPIEAPPARPPQPSTDISSPPASGTSARPGPGTPPGPSPSTPPAQASSSSLTGGWIAIGIGGALFAATGVTLALRQHEINTINTACNGGLCPLSQKSAITSAHDRAVLEGPLAGGFAAAGAIATGVGLYFVLRSDGDAQPSRAATRASLRIEPVLSPSEAGVGLRGSF